jgi:hypothetical protein
MLSKLYSLARIGAGVIVLSASGFVAQASADVRRRPLGGARGQRSI